MNKPLTILIDLDSTVYDLLTPTLAWVNAQKGLKLTPQDIKTWEWGKPLDIDLYAFWGQEGVFHNLKPFSHAKSALRTVNNWGIRQIFFSTLVDGPYVAWDKLRAVERDFPFIGKRGVLLTGRDKDIVRGDILVDDGAHNLLAFEGTGGTTVLAKLQGCSYSDHYKSNYVMTDWRQYPDIVRAEVEKHG